MSNPASAPLPSIHLLCVDEKYIAAFKEAQKTLHLKYPSAITTHNCSLGFLTAATKFDLIVSPANSFGLLDGGFDDAISRAFSPREDYIALTRVVQRKLYDEYRGFAPPGTCTLVRMPGDFEAKSRNIWGTKYLALCPTMKIPQDVTWDREVVYEVIWSLLCAIDKHNRSAPEGEKIHSILMTPMATGYGKVSPQRWAHQTVLAMKHFQDSIKNPAEWSKLNWADVDKTVIQVEETWGL